MILRLQQKRTAVHCHQIRRPPRFWGSGSASSNGTARRSLFGPQRQSLQLQQRCRKLQVHLSAAAMPDRETSPSQTTLHLWQSANAVCIDVDSTLCVDESIDVFAEWLGVGQAVAELTANAMQGGLKFEEALAARLDLMRPSKQKVQDFVASHPPQYSPGIPELVKALHQRGTAVFLVSGGFHAIIDPIAQHLGIPADHVFANTILFKMRDGRVCGPTQGVFALQEDEAGSYAGFDQDEFTSRSGGKLSAVKHIKAKFGHKVVVSMGDGATDLEARQPGGADIFIGYGGSVYRPTVAAGADWFVMSIQPLIDALKG